MLAALLKETTLQKVWALLLDPFTSALPSKVQGDAVTCYSACCCLANDHTFLALSAGRHLYQHHLVSYLSTQHQRTQQEGPDISLLGPALQTQWDHDRNAHLGNIVIKPFCSQRVWWSCNNCPDGHLHSWSASVFNRSNGNGCPQCSGHKVCKHNSLTTRAPKVAAHWEYEANSGTPESVLSHSRQICGWCCDACGHKWRSAPVASGKAVHLVAQCAQQTEEGPSTQVLQTAITLSWPSGSQMQCSSGKHTRQCQAAKQ